MSDNIYSYRAAGTDRWQHNGELTRQEAIAQAFYELDLDDDEGIFVFPIFPLELPLTPHDPLRLVDEWSEANHYEFPDDGDWYHQLYKDDRCRELKPEVEEKLRAALAPHQEAMSAAFQKVINEVIGGVWTSGAEEYISREEYEEMKKGGAQ